MADKEISLVFDALKEPKTSQAIAEELKISLDIVRQCLTELQASGKICRDRSNYQQVREESLTPKKPPLAVVEAEKGDIGSDEDLIGQVN